MKFYVIPFFSLDLYDVNYLVVGLEDKHKHIFYPWFSSLFFFFFFYFYCRILHFNSDLFLLLLPWIHSADPFAKKDWYDIKAPSVFQVKNVGKTLVSRTQGTKVFYFLLLFQNPFYIARWFHFYIWSEAYDWMIVGLDLHLFTKTLDE